MLLYRRDHRARRPWLCGAYEALLEAACAMPAHREPWRISKRSPARSRPAWQRPLALSQTEQWMRDFRARMRLAKLSEARAMADVSRDRKAPNKEDGAPEDEAEGQTEATKPKRRRTEAQQRPDLSPSKKALVLWLARSRRCSSSGPRSMSASFMRPTLSL